MTRPTLGAHSARLSRISVAAAPMLTGSMSRAKPMPSTRWMRLVTATWITKPISDR